MQQSIEINIRYEVYYAQKFVNKVERVLNENTRDLRGTSERVTQVGFWIGNLLLFIQRLGNLADFGHYTVYGKLFDVYTDPKELSVLETPKVPDGQMVYWQGLPYKLENGKVRYADNISIKENIIPKSKEIALKNRDSYGRYDFNDTGSYIWKDGEGNGMIVDWNQVPGAVKTDHVVQYSKDKGYHGTRFSKVYDGGVTLDKDSNFAFDYALGDYYDYPINELVLNPGASTYVLPHGKPKYKVFNQLPSVFTQPQTPFGFLPFTINNYDKRR